MGYFTRELDGRALQVMDGSPSEIGRNVFGETIDFLQHVHDGSGKPM